MLGYRLEEIQGQHHSMFVDPAYARTPEYQEFWAKLKSGEFVAAEFKRIGKGGREVWIQASYNPIFDLNEQVTKVVKFATDVTGRVAAVNQIGARPQPAGRGRPRRSGSPRRSSPRWSRFARTSTRRSTRWRNR